MRHVRHQRMISLHKDKQNQANKTNLPILESKCLQKISLKNEYRLNIKDKKKTYLKLCNRDDKYDKNVIKQRNVQSLISARFTANNSISPQLSSQYLSSRCEKRERTKYTNTNKSISTTNNSKILSRHKITINMRAKMLDWLMEIIDAYQLTDETYFLTVHIMDEFFKTSNQSLEIQQLHEIGVTSIFMACKYEQIHPLRLKTIYRDIGHSKIPTKKIIERESKIIRALNFSFAFKNPYMLCQEMLHDMSVNISGNQMKKIKEHSLYFLRLSTFDIDYYYSKKEQILSRACILAAIRLNSQGLSTVQLYDNFISSCTDYEKLHNVCTEIFNFNSSFLSDHPDLINILKYNPMKNVCNVRLHHKMIQSCAL